MAVGVVAASYHGICVKAPLRPLLRKLDYYTICYTSIILRRAARINLPSVVSLAAVLVAPVKPTAVTGLNLALVEVRAAMDSINNVGGRTCHKAAAQTVATAPHEQLQLILPALACLSLCHAAVCFGVTWEKRSSCNSRTPMVPHVWCLLLLHLLSSADSYAL